MEPVTVMIGAWLGELATVKIAEVLLTGVSSKLNPNDLDKALKAAIQAATDQDKHLYLQQKGLFFRCEDKDVHKFLEEFFKGVARPELQKPLNHQGAPQVDYLVAAFKEEAKEHSKLQGKIDESLVRPWMDVFVATYFKRTDSYLKFQVAKEDYFKQLENYFDDVKFAGIAVPGQEIDQSAQLAQIFVMPDVVVERQTHSESWLESPLLAESIGHRQGELLQEQRLRVQFDHRSGRKLNAQHLLNVEMFQGTPLCSRKIVLLGAPGSGKTTLMSYFAVMLAQKQPQRLGLNPDVDWLPILIKMRDFIRQPDISILDYIKYFAEKTLAVKSLPDGFFEYWLEEGRALIFLDGLDEVAEESKRNQVVRLIENFLGQFSDNQAIITSRPAGYRRDFFKTDEFPHYELQPFDDEKIEEFINRWYDSRIRDQEEAKRQKESLRKALGDKDRIKLLARNPLLLTIIALIHRYQAVLPKERYKLYDKAAETLLISWDANKELTNQTVLKYLGLDDLRRLMESLAYWIHTQGSTGDKEGGTLIDKDELISKLSKDIKTLKQIQLYEAKEEAKRFVDFIRERTGLLNEQGQDCYAFVHKTFQEYLCAEDINYRADDDDDFNIILEHIRQHLHDQHWREVLLLLIAKQRPKKAAKAIRAILERNSEYEQWLHRDLLFAGVCLGEDPKNLLAVDETLVQEILERLVKLDVSDEDWAGGRFHRQAFQTICRLSETQFEAQALKLVKNKKDSIAQNRLMYYQAALGERETVINALLSRLDDQDAEVRWRAAYILGNLGKTSETVVKTLLLRLGDEDSQVRSWAASALGNLGQTSETVINALLSRLDDQDSQVRYMAAIVLGNLGKTSETVINALLSRLDDQDSQVRYMATYALGELGETSERVVNALLVRLDDPNSQMRYMATYALGELGETSETVVNALLVRLDDRDSQMRQWAALALGKLGEASERVINPLLVRLDDEDSKVRSWAASALGNLGQGSEIVVNALVLRLDDQDAGVRTSAASALGELGKKSAHVTPAIIQWIEQHQDSEYLGNAIDVLCDLVGNG